MKAYGKKADRAARFALGLAISAATLRPGERRSIRELGAFCGVSASRIQQYEQEIFAKLRAKLNGDFDGWRELFERSTQASDSACVCSHGIEREVRRACDNWAQRTGRGRFA